LDFFASPNHSDPKFKSFLEDACGSLCSWISTTHEKGPLPSLFDLPDVQPCLEGLPPEQLLEDIQKLMSGSYHSSHPGALAHLDPPPLTGSIIGELICAGLNNNLLAEELSPSITKLERSLCKWISEQLGMPSTSGGVAACGGSLANLMALLVARSNSNSRYNSDAVVLVSEEAHVSIARAVSVMGLPPDSLCKISTDEDGRIDITSLKKKFAEIKTLGKTCIAVVATAGTTVRGAIDPLTEISHFCRVENLWLHVDAAIGGVFALSTSTKKLVSDLSKANSVTVNPQKLLGITKTSSLLLVSHFDDLFKCFSTGFPYIEPSSDLQVQGGEIGLQGTRAAEIIKLWIGLRQLGQNGIQLLLEQAIFRRRYLAEKLDSRKLKVITGPLHLLAVTPLNATSLEADEWSVRTKSQLLESNFLLSRPKYQNRYYLKAVMGNPHTQTSHIDELAEALNQSV
jgi:glutamate/tyrosine decarboxylase-like PLP-dependent enzyme